MKRAGLEALDRLEPLLRELRKRAELNEKARETFFRGGRGFLHFHKHREGLFADVGLNEDFAKLPGGTRADRKGLMREIDAVLRAGKTG